MPPGRRKSLPGNRQGIEPSGEPSVAPAGREGEGPSPSPHRADTYVGVIEVQSRLLGVPLDGDQLEKIGAYAKTLVEERGATRAQMLRWATHYATRRSENSKIRPSQAWADVADGRQVVDRIPRGGVSTSVVGATEDLFEGDI